MYIVYARMPYCIRMHTYATFGCVVTLIYCLCDIRSEHGAGSPNSMHNEIRREMMAHAEALGLEVEIVRTDTAAS